MTVSIPNSVASNHTLRQVGHILTNGGRFATTSFAAHSGLTTQLEQLYRRAEAAEAARIRVRQQVADFQEQGKLPLDLSEYALPKRGANAKKTEKPPGEEHQTMAVLLAADATEAKLCSETRVWIERYLGQAVGHVPQARNTAAIPSLVEELGQLMAEAGALPILAYLLRAARAALDSFSPHRVE